MANVEKKGFKLGAQMYVERVRKGLRTREWDKENVMQKRSATFRICFPSRSYSDIELHRTMIEDTVRTNAYQQAIFQNMEENIRGKVVVDVGCGTGILSMFCAQAGAKKVYAIDASKIAVHAKQLIEANGFKDVITGK